MKENLSGINALADAFFEYRREIVKIKIMVYFYYIIAALCVIILIPIWTLLDFGKYNNLFIGSISVFIGILAIIMVFLARSKRTILKILRKKMVGIFESVFCLRNVIKKEEVDIVLLNAIDLKLFLIDPNV